jgi:phospholipid/cholesterol/gamma-HCH transport system substrate-binding protein
VNALTKNASIAAVEASKLTAELALLSRTARKELGAFSTTAQSLTRTSNQTLAQVGNVASRFGNTADQYSLTAVQLSRLASSANDLVVSNRGNLVGTLDSVRQTSDQLRQLLGSFTPVVAQLNSTAGQLNTATSQVKVGELVKNLETLSANAAQASANLRDITTSFNNPNNVVLLQQTLDSARATFENTQKITSDLDELTGDPAFRENVKKLVNGLGKLVSSTQQLQQEVRVAEQLEPVSKAINTTVSSAIVIPQTTQQLAPKVEPTTAVIQPNIPQPALLFPPAAKKPSPQATSGVVVNLESKKHGNKN